MNSDRSGPSKEKKILSQSGRVASGASVNRRKPGASVSKPNKQPLSQSQKSLVSGIDIRTKTNGSECNSARKNNRQRKESGFKHMRNKVMGENKENAKKEGSTHTFREESQLTNTLQIKTNNTGGTPRYNHQAQPFYLKQETGYTKSRSTSKSDANTFRAPPSFVMQRPLSVEDFQIGKKLGRGRFGDVFLVRERRLGMIMAMKMINRQELKESDMMGQLIFEIKIQSFVTHPNTLRMYGYFHDEKYIYMLLELASSGCLFRELKSKVCFKEHQAAYYLRQVIAGLKHLHTHSIMHRDIKPENILNSFGVLKLCDFGWAVYSPLQYSIHQGSQRQTFCGTLDYVPPEIVQGEFYDEKVDIWCIGILCYELCTGHAPFEAKDNELETYDKILSLDLQFPVSLSSEVVDFISRLLTKDPQARMSFAEMEEHPFMKKHQNEAGRLISREIWEGWQRLRGTDV